MLIQINLRKTLLAAEMSVAVSSPPHRLNDLCNVSSKSFQFHCFMFSYVNTFAFLSANFLLAVFLNVTYLPGICCNYFCIM